jgi:type II secretory pathway component PulF
MPINQNNPAPQPQKNATKTQNKSFLSGEVTLFKKKPTAKERMLFTEQLILLLETGASLHEALAAMERQFRNSSMLSVVTQLKEDVSSGKSFSIGLSRHSDVFDQTFLNLVSASEAGGFLVPVLKELLLMDEKSENLKSTLKGAFSYPVFLMLFSFGVVLFVLLVVFPKFQELFMVIEDQLPISTIVLMSMSHALAQYWWLMLIVIAGATGFFIGWSRTSNGIEIIDGLKLRLPVIRTVFIQMYLVQSLRVMGLSINNGVNILETIASCRLVVKNVKYQKFMSDLEKEVTNGAGISIGFEKSEFIPDIVKQMIVTGEQSGKLAMVMQRISDYYEKELTNRVQMLSKLAEPVMLLVMGVVVGVLVSSLILPIFKLSRAVH